MALSPGQEVGPYLIQEEVGAGGLGRVYRGLDRRNGRTVAIKVLHDGYMRSRKFLGIFHRELLIVSGLRHKHIVSYLDSHFAPPVCYIVTEFITGWSLHAFQKRVGPIPPLVALSIMMGIAQGVDYLHLHDVTHSDLSAPNVLIDVHGRVLVTDFGLAAKKDVEDYKNYLVGTPGYYSPEHVSDAPITPQADIYCMGLLLYEMLVGAKAVPADSSRTRVLEAMKNIDYARIQTADPDMTRALQKIVARATQYSPGRRYGSVEALMYDCYQVMKRYHLRYARHAIRRFLMDRDLVRGPFDGREQKIYIGVAS